MAKLLYLLASPETTGISRFPGCRRFLCWSVPCPTHIILQATDLNQRSFPRINYLATCPTARKTRRQIGKPFDVPEMKASMMVVSVPIITYDKPLIFNQATLPEIKQRGEKGQRQGWWEVIYQRRHENFHGAMYSCQKLSHLAWKAPGAGSYAVPITLQVVALGSWSNSQTL